MVHARAAKNPLRKLATEVFQYVIASIHGCIFGFFLIARLIRLCGEKVRQFIEPRLEIDLIL